jgi:hypothetical protein
MKNFLLAGFVALSTFVAAQYSWIQQDVNFSTDGARVDLVTVVNANTVWATIPYSGGYLNHILRSTDGGLTWQQRSVTGINTGNTMISDLTAVDANTAWVAVAPTANGGDNGIYKTTDGGATWTKQTTASFSLPDSFANSVYFWDANNGWAAGDVANGSNYEMYKTSNGGTTWTPVTTATGAAGDGYYNMRAGVRVVGDNIFLGTVDGLLLRSTNRGATWTQEFSPASSFGTEGIYAFKDANNGVLITRDGWTGSNSELPSLSFMYTTSNGGHDWDFVHYLDDPADSEYQKWFFDDIVYVPGTANTYVSVGGNVNNSNGFAYRGSSYSEDGGLTWTLIENENILFNANFLSSSIGWAGAIIFPSSGLGGIMKFDGDFALATSEASVKSNLKIFPNPAADVVNISSNKKIESVNIIDLSGKRVMGAKGEQINVSSLAKGTYILQVSYGGGAVENTKLIKK